MYRETLDDLQICRFGAGETADRLLAQVLSGRKTAASWPARHGRWTRVGERMLAYDGQGRPRAVLETTALELKRFCDVDEDFAWAEGEGDLSLRWWRVANRIYLQLGGYFAEDMELWCERFRVVEVLDLDADEDALPHAAFTPRASAARDKAAVCS